MYYELYVDVFFLIDCSFTLLAGVLGVSNVGVVPTIGLLAVVQAFSLCVVVPKSSLGETGRSACCVRTVCCCVYIVLF